MKKLLTLLCFATCLELSGMANSTATIPLTKETTWLVHKSKVFPREGRLIAGTLPVIGTRKNNQVIFSSDQGRLLSNAAEQAQACMPALRNTIHWSANGLVFPHERQIVAPDGTLISVDPEVRAEYPYIILEKRTAFSGKQLFGYWQDIFHMGGHTLSEEAYVIVPQEDTVDTPYYGFFKDRIIRASLTEGRQVVEQFLVDHAAPVLYPCMEGITPSRQIRFNSNHRQQAVDINQATYPSRDISQIIGVDHTVAESHPVVQLHNYGLHMTAPLRNTLTCLFALQKLAGKEVLSSCCFICGTIPSKLFACGKCHNIYYCSATCQRAHWPTHKELCSEHLSCFTALTKQHELFLHKLKLYGYLQGNALITVDVSERYTEAKKLVSGNREKHLLTSYRTYLEKLLMLIYGCNAQSEALRKSHGVNSISGFMAYCKRIRDEMKEDAHEFEGDRCT